MDNRPATERVLDLLGEGVAVVDDRGTLAAFNLAAEKITGLMASAFLGRDASEAFPGHNLHKVISSGVPEHNIQKKYGQTSALLSIIPLVEDGGEGLGAVVLIRDKTEVDSLTSRVKELWQSRQLLESVIESIDDAISVADEHGNNIIVNPAYSRLTGLPKDEVIGKPATEDIAEGESMHMKVLQTGKPVRNAPLKVGPLKRDVIVHVAPIEIDGKIAGSVGVIHDISEIKRLTSELTETRGLLRRLRAKYTWDDITGESMAMVSAKEQALRAAETPATVLLRGESGIGKELFAHAIHNASDRSGEQFVSVNCAAIAESLLESEIFGYEEGAFTGALKGGKKGFFEEAQGGTIFLDEIGDLGPALQSKLLRVLQEREIVRVGGTDSIGVDVRVIAATNADLEDKVKDNTFREDLYYRLNVIPIHLVPLRNRIEDIPELARHMLFRLNQEYHRLVESISDEAIAALVRHNWPGNVRELQNVLGQAMLNMHPKEKLIEVTHLPPLGSMASVRDVRQAQGVVRKLKHAVAEAEAGAIRSALAQTGGNRTEAAKVLGVSLRSLYYKIERYDIT